MDLRLVLFVVLFVAILMAWAAVWLDRWLHRRRLPFQSDEDHLRQLLDRAPLGLLLLDPQGRYRYANHYARSLLDLSAAPHVLPKDDWVEALNEDRRLARAQQNQGSRYRISNLSDERALRWWVTPWEQWDLALVHDVSAEQRAAQSARFMMSDLSHELRTPIATLLTQLAVLQLPSADETQRTQFIGLMQSELERLSRLVNGVLELGRLETGMALDQRPLDLRQLVEEAVSQMRIEAEIRDIGLTVEGDSRLPQVVGNDDRLRQLLLILLDNALKYTRGGDHVRVTLEHNANTVRCAVCDNGPGIAADAIPKLTRRFYRADIGEQIAGSGLGLALAAEILRRHHSALIVDSNTVPPDTGTCVHFDLVAIRPIGASR